MTLQLASCRFRIRVRRLQHTRRRARRRAGRRYSAQRADSCPGSGFAGGALRVSRSQILSPMPSRPGARPVRTERQRRLRPRQPRNAARTQRPRLERELRPRARTISRNSHGGMNSSGTPSRCAARATQDSGFPLQALVGLQRGRHRAGEKASAPTVRAPPVERSTYARRGPDARRAAGDPLGAGVGMREAAAERPRLRCMRVADQASAWSRNAQPARGASSRSSQAGAARADAAPRPFPPDVLQRGDLVDVEEPRRQPQPPRHHRHQLCPGGGAREPLSAAVRVGARAARTIHRRCRPGIFESADLTLRS